MSVWVLRDDRLENEIGTAVCQASGAGRSFGGVESLVESLSASDRAGCRPESLVLCVGASQTLVELLSCKEAFQDLKLFVIIGPECRGNERAIHRLRPRVLLDSENREELLGVLGNLKNSTKRAMASKPNRTISVQ